MGVTMRKWEGSIFTGDKDIVGSLELDGDLRLDAYVGDEKVTNGAFTGNADGWTLGAQWAYGSNAVAKSGAGTSTLSQDVSAIANEIYKVVYTTSGISGGSITVSIGGVSGTARTTNATFTEYITATGTGSLTFTPASATAVTIDDVSVKRVGVSATDRVNAWVGDRLSAGVAQAGDAGLFLRTEDGTRHFFGDYVGIGTTGPDSVLHIQQSDAGTFTNNEDDILVLEKTGGTNIDIRTDNADNCGILFSDPDARARGYIIYGHADDSLQISAAGSERGRFTSAGAFLINGTAAYGRNGQLFEVNTSANNGGIAVNTWRADSSGGLLDFNLSRSATIGTHTIVQNADALGSVYFRGSDGTAFRDAAYIRGEIDGTPGASDMPGRLVFATTADGASAGTEAMRITSAQKVLIGGTVAYGPSGQMLEVNTSANWGSVALNTWSATAGQGSLIVLSRSKSATIGTYSIVASGDSLGGIYFKGSDAASFHDAASIEGFIDGTPGSSDMPGRLVFSTTADGAAAVTEALRIDSTQEVRALAGNIKIANATDGGTGGMHIRSKRAVSAAMSGATVNIATQVPSGAIILGAQFNVDTLIEGATTWSAAFNTGSTTSLGTGYALAQNTKVNFLVAPEKASAATDITLTAAGSNFTAGVIEALVYYIDQTSMANA